MWQNKINLNYPVIKNEIMKIKYPGISQVVSIVLSCSWWEVDWQLDLSKPGTAKAHAAALTKVVSFLNASSVVKVNGKTKKENSLGKV